MDNVTINVQDANTSKKKSLQLNTETATLGLTYPLILGLDWFTKNVNKIVINPLGLEFKKLIDIELVKDMDEWACTLETTSWIGMIRHGGKPYVDDQDIEWIDTSVRYICSIEAI